MRICRGCCGHLGQRWKKNRRATRGRIMGVRPTQSREGVKGGLRPFSSAPCRVKGQRPLWGWGQRLNCWSGDQYQESCQQRRRQQSVPASNFARPQTRPQASLANHYALSRQMGATTPPAASAHNPPKNLGTTAQLGGASADVFSAICGMQISRFTASKPSKFAFASDEKSIRQPTTSFVRCYPCTNPPNMIEYPLTRGTEQWQAPILLAT